MVYNGEKVIIFWSQSFYAPDYTYVVCGFKLKKKSCQEFDRLLCNCSVKGCRENTMRQTTCLICDVMLPVTGVDKNDNLSIGITETLHVPQLIMDIIKLLHVDVWFSLHEKLSFKSTKNICVIRGT